MSDDEKLKSARGRPDIESPGEGHDPVLPLTGPLDRWRQERVAAAAGPLPKPSMTAPRAPAPLGELLPAEPVAASVEEAPTDPWLTLTGARMREVEAQAKKLLGPDAFVHIGLNIFHSTLELRWEVGIEKSNFSRGENGGVIYQSRDLWGFGATFEDALADADACFNPKGGRRG